MNKIRYHFLASWFCHHFVFISNIHNIFDSRCFYWFIYATCIRKILYYKRLLNIYLPISLDITKMLPLYSMFSVLSTIFLLFGICRTQEFFSVTLAFISVGCFVNVATSDWWRRIFSLCLLLCVCCYSFLFRWTQASGTYAHHGVYG